MNMKIIHHTISLTDKQVHQIRENLTDETVEEVLGYIVQNAVQGVTPPRREAGQINVATVSSDHIIPANDEAAEIFAAARTIEAHFKQVLGACLKEIAKRVHQIDDRIIGFKFLVSCDGKEPTVYSDHFQIMIEGNWVSTSSVDFLRYEVVDEVWRLVEYTADQIDSWSEYFPMGEHEFYFSK
jgi:hypothetical protein